LLDAAGSFAAGDGVYTSARRFVYAPVYAVLCQAKIDRRLLFLAPTLVVDKTTPQLQKLGD
jgi:hypothetical protein